MVKDYSYFGIAQEIFAHAVIFYATSVAILLGVDNQTILNWQESGRVVNIADGGNDPRGSYFSLIWWGSTALGYNI